MIDKFVTVNLAKRKIQMIKMKAISVKYLILSVCSLLMLSCGSDSQTSELSKPREAAGGRYYGSVLKTNETEYIKTLFPLSIVDVYSYRVASQIYEGICKLDPKTLKVTNGLAENISPNEDHSVYTVKLRKGVKFHDADCFEDGKGRELKASDIKYCFERLCTRNPQNQAFHVFEDVIKGTQAYYEATKGGGKPSGGLEGVKVIDDYTVEFTLEKPNTLFLSYLARPEAFIYPREAFEKYGIEMNTKAVGTGPFVLGPVEEDISIMLLRNKNYYKKDKHGNQLPFLDGVKVKFIKDKKTEFFEFKRENSNLDMVYRLPTEYIIEIIDAFENANALKSYELDRQPEMQTQLLSFMNRDGLMNDLNIRKALSFAIDREKILNYVLNGEGFDAGHHGITPPSFKNKGYDIRDIRGYKFNADSARYYLNAAGYPDGANFPEITLFLNADGDRHTNVAIEVEKQLREVLNIDIEVKILSHAQLTNKMQLGDYKVIRSSWVADYPNPEAFLRLFYSKGMPEELGVSSYPNFIRYKNPEFDKVFEEAMNAPSEEETYELFKKAESIAMEDAPVIVLWYDEGFRLLKRYVKNFPNNPMQYRDYSEVYIIPHEAPKSGKKE